MSCKFAGCRAKTDVEICADALVFKAKGGDVAVPLASIGAVLPFAHPMAQKKQDIVVLHLAAPVGKISDILLTVIERHPFCTDLNSLLLNLPIPRTV